MFAGVETTELVKSWLAGIQSVLETVTGINSENIHDAEGSTSIEEKTDSETANEEIGPVVEAIEETLLPGARERILRITKEKTGEASISAFAETMKDVYEITGTINKMAEWFSDGGKKVISELEKITAPDANLQKWFSAPTETALTVGLESKNTETPKINAEKNENKSDGIEKEIYRNKKTGVTYRIIKRNERNAIVEVTENGKTTEFVLTNEQVNRITSDKQNVRVGTATNAEPGNMTKPKESITDNKTESSPNAQLIQDYNNTVDDILTVSDEIAKELADKRVAVEVSKNTPAVILDNVENARDLKIIINYNKLYLAVRKGGVFKGHYHNLGAEIAKKLPDFISNPDAIIQLDNGRLNIFATVETARGNNGIVSVELNSTKDIGGKNEDYNVVVTLFSSDDNYVGNLLSSDEVTVKYKREDLSQVNPQLYKWLATINDKSSIDNIVPQGKNVVKNSIRNESENDASKTYDVASLEKVSSNIRKGERISLEEVRVAVDALILNRGEAVKTELSKLKNDELKKKLNLFDRSRYTKKADMVNAVYDDMVSDLYFAISGKDTITYIYDGTGHGNQTEKMLFDASREISQDEFGKRLSENAEKFEKQQEVRAEKLSKIKNPQNLKDFAYKKRNFGLSVEETEQYEKLYSEERKKRREENKTSDKKDTAGADAFLADADKYIVEKTTHTKTGDDVWVVKPKERLETEAWKQLNEQMKALGGSYWRGNQGWNFKKDPTAALSSTEETETSKGSTNAEKLRTVADGMQKAIDDKFRDRLTNTAKRAREAASAEAEGEKLKKIQATISNIASAIESGEVSLIDKIDSRAQIETLMSMLYTSRRNRISDTMPDITYDERLKEQEKPFSVDDIRHAEYPLSRIHESAVQEYIRASEGKPGYKQITARLSKALKAAEKGYVKIDSQLFNDIDKIVKNLATYRADFWNDGVSERKRLARMGIENVVELRAYLREFIEYIPGRDAKAEKQRLIKAKERELANAKIEGFFPTPKAIVEKMLDEADIKKGESVLEPSAGKGNIADVIREKHPDNSLDVVEWNSSLSELLSEKGHNVVGSDFLQTTEKYDKIVMNPPFEKGQDIDHIKHAYSLLNDGGRVVCIMSEGPFFRSDKKATEFREWLDEVGGVSEKLPEGTFKTSERSTGVNTRLVVIDKQEPANVQYSFDSDSDLQSDSDNGIIDADNNLSESGEMNDTQGNNTRRTGRVPEGAGNQGRRNSGDTGNVSAEEATVGDKVLNRRFDRGRASFERSSTQSLDMDTYGPEGADTSGGRKTDGERFLEAVIRGDEATARKLLDRQAKRNGFVPARVYHGTRAESAFTKFNSDSAIWVSTNKRYAERYAEDNLAGVESYLFTEADSAVYDLYVKHGKVLDLGNINEELDTPRDVINFGKEIGFSKDEIRRCWNSSRQYESNAKWTLSITSEFAEIAREHGYDSLKATEADGIETYGILYAENVKSAKTVTYDDNGNVIPLDERFDTRKNEIRYAIEGENINEQTGNILSDDSGKRQNGKSARKPVKTMDGRSSRYRERRSTAYQRRKLCQTLRDAGNTETKVVHGHKCEVIPAEHYDKRMQKLVDKNKADGYDETILITGQATLPFVKDKNGKPKTARGVFIETTSGKRIAIVQYDHEHYMPEQINDHEKVHKNYKSKRTQKVKNLILNSLSIREKKDVLERLSKDYNGVIQGNEEAIFEEFVANVLSGMNEYTVQFNDVVKAYWAGDDATIDSFKVSEYTESIDAGGINADVLDNVGFGEDSKLLLPEPDGRTHIKYSPKGIKLPKNELAKFNSSVSTDYYLPYKTHEGLQYQSCVTDNTHILYVYEDGGFGNYNLVARIDYANIDVANAIIKELGNGTAYRITEVVNTVLKTFEVRRSGYTVYNAYSKKRISTRGDDSLLKRQPNTKSRGTDAGSSRFTGNERGTGTVKYSLDTLEKDSEVLTSERKKQILKQWEKNRVGHEDKTTKEQLADWGNKQKEAWGERGAWIAHNMSRVFPNIPERGERGTFFAEFRKNMIQWKSLPTTASFMVQDKLNQMTEGLSPEEFKTFSELVYFLDLKEEAQIQKDKGYTEILLPNEISPAEVDAIVNELNKEASSKVKKALKKRTEIWDELKQQYVDLNRYIGFDTDGKFKRKNYYHHQVIEYMNGGGKGTGSRNMGIKAGRGWLKERHGSTEAINTDFLAVEYKAMRK